jgi:hypothetical protein
MRGVPARSKTLPGQQCLSYLSVSRGAVLGRHPGRARSAPPSALRPRWHSSSAPSPSGHWDAFAAIASPLTSSTRSRIHNFATMVAHNARFGRDDAGCSPFRRATSSSQHSFLHRLALAAPTLAPTCSGQGHVAATPCQVATSYALEGFRLQYSRVTSSLLARMLLLFLRQPS